MGGTEMPKITADELARDILSRQGVKADRGPSIGARCSARQTAYLFSLIAPERIGHVGGSPDGPRVGHGDGWTISEQKFGCGMLVLDTRTPEPWVAALALLTEDAARWEMDAINDRLEAARRALAERRNQEEN